MGDAAGELNKGQTGQAGEEQGRDPLGRKSSGDREGTYGQNPNGNFDDATNVQRAREILEIIRKRLGENFRLEFVKDYLERLLKTPQ